MTHCRFSPVPEQDDDELCAAESGSSGLRRIQKDAKITVTRLHRLRQGIRSPVAQR